MFFLGRINFLSRISTTKRKTLDITISSREKREENPCPRIASISSLSRGDGLNWTRTWNRSDSTPAIQGGSRNGFLMWILWYPCISLGSAWEEMPWRNSFSWMLQWWYLPRISPLWQAWPRLHPLSPWLGNKNHQVISSYWKQHFLAIPRVTCPRWCWSPWNPSLRCCQSCPWIYLGWNPWNALKHFSLMPIQS